MAKQNRPVKPRQRAATGPDGSAADKSVFDDQRPGDAKLYTPLRSGLAKLASRLELAGY